MASLKGESSSLVNSPLIIRHKIACHLGALGQIGRALLGALRFPPPLFCPFTFCSKENQVYATDAKKPNFKLDQSIVFTTVDVTCPKQTSQIIQDTKPDWVIHLSAILSGAGEGDPEGAHRVNVDGFMNMLRLAVQHHFRLLSPSSIAIFGPESGKERAPQSTITRPCSVYGITKLHNELMGEYYQRRFGVDFRSLRLPGVLSADSLADSKGTTDYAVEMIRAAAQSRPYTCFLLPETPLPMLHIEDCVGAMVGLLSAKEEVLTQRVYNLHSMTFTPAQLAKTIATQIDNPPKITYQADFRQAIADSWPHSMDDSVARRDWKWNPRLDLQATVGDLLLKFQRKSS